MEIKRGEIYYADLRPVIGSEQNGSATSNRYYLL